MSSENSGESMQSLSSGELDIVTWDEVFGSVVVTPEHKLLVATLEHALRAIGRYRRLSYEYRRKDADGIDAYCWIFTPDPSEAGWPFTFDNICLTLKIDPDWLKRLIQTRGDCIDNWSTWDESQASGERESPRYQVADEEEDWDGWRSDR